MLEVSFKSLRKLHLNTCVSRIGKDLHFLPPVSADYWGHPSIEDPCSSRRFHHKNLIISMLEATRFSRHHSYEWAKGIHTIRWLAAGDARLFTWISWMKEGGSLIRCPLLRQNILLSSTTVLTFSIRAASTATSKPIHFFYQMYLQHGADMPATVPQSTRLWKYLCCRKVYS